MKLFKLWLTLLKLSIKKWIDMKNLLIQAVAAVIILVAAYYLIDFLANKL
ncbi:MAG: hypothetical protein VW666_05605 [Methylophilaceae bacterium]